MLLSLFPEKIYLCLKMCCGYFYNPILVSCLYCTISPMLSHRCVEPLLRSVQGRENFVCVHLRDRSEELKWRLTQACLSDLQPYMSPRFSGPRGPLRMGNPGEFDVSPESFVSHKKGTVQMRKLVLFLSFHWR